MALLDMGAKMVGGVKAEFLKNFIHATNGPLADRVRTRRGAPLVASINVKTALNKA
jgi:hypothetical protein